MVLSEHPVLSIARQCGLLGISRSAWYRPQCLENAHNLELMRVMDELFLQMPYLGSRQMRSRLRRMGHKDVGRKRVRRLMRVMGLRAVYQKPRTSVPHPEHPVYPYLLRGLAIAKPNQVWCADITYIPMRRGFLYLVAIMDWHSRKVLSWRLSNTLESDFCVAALEDALSRYGAPEICNTDQGCQFTSLGFIALLQGHNIRISMDGKGCWGDNIMVERLWRSLKYENIYLHAYETGSEARRGIGQWIVDYNQNRGHSSLGDCTPDEIYRGLPIGSPPLHGKKAA
jgi:putative transposase